MSLLGKVLPAHVAAVEVVGLGTKDESHRYHAFLRIAQRDEWIAKDTRSRECISIHHPKILEAWDAFAIVLHAEPRMQRRLWNS